MNAILNILLSPIVLLVKAMWWWSKHVDGINPKVGNILFVHKTVDGVMYSRRAGFRHLREPWTPVRSNNGITNRDIESFYPNIIQ